MMFPPYTIDAKTLLRHRLGKRNHKADNEIQFDNYTRMAFSKTTGYGIRALAYLASQPFARLCELQEIAKQESIPPIYLRKVLRELRRRRLLNSVKGVHGGYELTRQPETISLWEVFQILDPEPYRFEQCILAHGICAQQKPCAACQACQALNQQYVDWLQATTIAHLQRA